ncbi:DUF5591 domain-containing protein [Oxyplasma meridianum]|uniref:DUF5591 domain-containing protein n=1 Tax=Oxyplasma meridianum TaxID=3073602 RepID=A0AAX4NFU0_9ARCH
MVFKDNNFFGFARTGIAGERWEYPIILNTQNQEEFLNSGEELIILGNRFKKVITYPETIRSIGNRGFEESEDMVMMLNTLEIIERPKQFVSRIISIRNEIGWKKLIYAPGIGDPFLIPVLVYLGISVFDDIFLRKQSYRGLRYTPVGVIKDGSPLESNQNFVRGEMAVIRESIRNGTLREMVEKVQFSSKALEILRILDFSSYEIIEPVFPSRTPYIMANSIESLERPDLKRYREKITNSYEKPVNREVALIMPCSARKPYSTSRTHMEILSRIGEFRQYIHELIVTSPVALVPRELENIYPAMFYNIPVVGHWYEDEKVIMKNTLSAYLKRNTYKKIIAYITEDLEFISEILPSDSLIMAGDIKSESNLRWLYSALESTLKETDLKRGSRMDQHVSRSKFQFGNWIEKYIEGAKVINNYNQEMLVVEGKPAIVFNENLGKYTINKSSAKWFIENGKFLVEIDDFKPTSNVYPVGVVDATEDIRTEDEVVLHHKGEVKGVGIAKMPFRAMKELKKGIAVKVRN